MHPFGNWMAILIATKIMKTALAYVPVKEVKMVGVQFEKQLYYQGN